jgi:hypothetical protein
VNLGVVFVDQGMVTLEIPVMERPHVVALIGNVAVQRGHCVQVRRTHAYSSFRHQASPASPRTARPVTASGRTSLNLSRTGCGLRAPNPMSTAGTSTAIPSPGPDPRAGHPQTSTNFRRAALEVEESQRPCGARAFTTWRSVPTTKAHGARSRCGSPMKSSVS